MPAPQKHITGEYFTGKTIEAGVYERCSFHKCKMTKCVLTGCFVEMSEVTHVVATATDFVMANPSFSILDSCMLVSRQEDDLNGNICIGPIHVRVGEPA